jgi:hypothetical protein
MRSSFHFITAIWIPVLLLSIVGTVWPAGVRDTRHNLSSTPPTAPITRNIYSQTVDEICVFCHTPHSALKDGTNSTPLWNHTLSTQVYPTLPTGGTWPNLLTTVRQPDLGSKLCLSCHDGTVAIGSLANLPGAGSGGTVSMVGVTAAGAMPSSAYGYIGIDLSGTHPVSIPVNDSLINAKNAACAPGKYYILYPPGNANVKLKPTNNTYNDGTTGYPHTTSAGVTYYEGVQCASCHDPHNNNTDFLVVSGIGGGPPSKYHGTTNWSNWSALCNACHQPCP